MIRKTPLTIIKISGAILGFLLLIVIAAFLYALYNPDYDISPAAYHWKKGMDDREIEMTAARLVSQMSLEEKVDQMDGDGGIWGWIRLGIRFGLLKQFNIQYAGRNTRLDIPPIAFSDGPRGITVGHSTCFPVAMARGATWDVDLERKVGDALGQEARALGVNYFGGLCINLLRHPGWGRAQETYGEDPWLLAQMATSLTKSIQRHNVMACAKHFALNSIENSRFYVDVRVDERTLREVYLPHFKAFVHAGGASVMSAYNKVNGEYCGQNRHLLTEILRDVWGFRGFVTSDWMMGVHDGIKAVKAGLDIEMPLPIHYGKNLVNAVRSGKVKESLVDERVQRIVRTKLKFVTRTDPMKYPRSLVANREHRDLAREVAEKSMVLLKNDGALLPLDSAHIETLAVIGRLANVANTGDHGSSYFKPPYVITPLEGIKNYAGKNIKILYSDGKDVNTAGKMAAQADAVIVITGLDYRDEGEYITTGKGKQIGNGGDRKSLTLHPQDEALIRAVAGVNDRCIVGLMGGSAIIMENWKRSVPAILMIWYPGMEGGNALARVLFGEVNTSGKLPFTIPVAESQLPHFDPADSTTEYGYYHGYTLFDHNHETPAFPFGFGLSYTAFHFDSLLTSIRDGIIRVEVCVTNTGSRLGTETVQLYAGMVNPPVERPEKLLRGFRKVTLQPEERMKVTFALPIKNLARYDPGRKRWIVDAGKYRIFAGSSSCDEQLISKIISVNNESDQAYF